MNGVARRRVVEIPFNSRSLLVGAEYRIPEGDYVLRFLSFTCQATAVIASVAVAELTCFNKSVITRIAVRDSNLLTALNTTRLTWFPEAGSIISGTSQLVRTLPFLELLTGGDRILCSFPGSQIGETFNEGLLTYLVLGDG